ncbi:MAG: Asp-tRNA(Asn)/Glu-tRNA(Gln) amidotransferase subunit GatA [Candidatus Micrarchaeia archaeon]
MQFLEHVEKKISEIEKREHEVGAFIEAYSEEARKKAKALDARAKGGETPGALAGTVIAVKNNIAIRGRRLTCASKMLEKYVAPYNATVIERLESAGAIIIGSANLDEFACGSDCTKSGLAKTKNPIDPERVAGGSSGGSAAAVAAGFADAALGSDTGGSIRCPSSFCGVLGFKPTYGLVSRHGLADLAMTFDQIGPIAKTAHGAAKVLDAIAGEDEKDPSTLGAKTGHFAKAVEAGLPKAKVGVPKEFFEGCNGDVARIVRQKISLLEKRGFEMREISLPLAKYSIPIYYTLIYSEFASAMQKYDGLRYGAGADVSEDLVTAVSKTRSANIGAECKRRILLGTLVTMQEHRDAWYTHALKARGAFKKSFEHALSEVDFLVGPTMPVLPWKLGEKAGSAMEMYLADVLTVPANICGLPAGSVNAGFAGKLPVGLQVIGKRFDDARALAFLGEIGKAD